MLANSSSCFAGHQESFLFFVLLEPKASRKCTKATWKIGGGGGEGVRVGGGRWGGDNNVAYSL